MTRRNPIGFKKWINYDFIVLSNKNKYILIYHLQLKPNDGCIIILKKIKSTFRSYDLINHIKMISLSDMLPVHINDKKMRLILFLTPSINF